MKTCFDGMKSLPLIVNICIDAQIECYLSSSHPESTDAYNNSTSTGPEQTAPFFFTPVGVSHSYVCYNLSMYGRGHVLAANRLHLLDPNTPQVMEEKKLEVKDSKVTTDFEILRIRMRMEMRMII